MVGDEALLSEQIGLRTDRHTGRQTDQQAIVRKRADGPDYIPRLFPLVVTAATSLICHSSPSVCM